LDALKLDNLVEEEEDAMFLVLFCDDNEVVCVSLPETVVGRHIVLLSGNSPLKRRKVKCV
jgi:hypothetical protein